MCKGKLKGITPSCKDPFVAKLKKHNLRFHKQSTDESGKADAYPTDNETDEVLGVVFNVDDSEVRNLDESEGGYNRTDIEVFDNEGNLHNVETYIAKKDKINSTLKPYTWYKRLVIEGACQHSLPREYIAKIEVIESEEDPDKERNAKNRVIQC
jgi:gamma-glutamylcyclotransferase (GGCT)/AIG2-like uncharacterized protein YtfP